MKDEIWIELIFVLELEYRRLINFCDENRLPETEYDTEETDESCLTAFFLLTDDESINPNRLEELQESATAINALRIKMAVR